MHYVCTQKPTFHGIAEGERKTAKTIYWPGRRSLKRRGRSACCCWATGTTVTGIESNYDVSALITKHTYEETYAHAFKQVLGLLVDVQCAALRVLGEVESRDLGNVLILALSLFFLQLEGNTTDRSPLDTLHQMCGVSGNLVSQALGGNDGDLIADTLVDLKIERELGVVATRSISFRS
jgi:hypothetical protein